MGWTGICGVQPLHQVRGWASMKLNTVNHFLYFNGAEATPGIRLPLKFFILYIIDTNINCHLLPL